MGISKCELRIFKMTSSRKVIYFCGSKFGGRQDEVLYNILFKKLDRYGDVIQPFDPEKGINQLGSRREHGLSMHDRDVALLTMCDVMVAEVTHPSLGVGYEIGRAVELGKPVLCLYRPLPRKNLSFLLRGMDNKDHLRVYDYDPEHVDMIFQDFIPKYINFKVPKEEEEEPSQPQFSRQAQGPPGLGTEILTKSQLKNKKRREASRNTAAACEVDGGNKNAPPRQLKEEVNVLSDQEKAKIIRRLSNKLESIQKIKQQQAEGKPLEQNQVEKLSREQEILDEFNALKLSTN